MQAGDCGPHCSFRNRNGRPSQILRLYLSGTRQLDQSLHASGGEQAQNEQHQEDHDENKE